MFLSHKTAIKRNRLSAPATSLQKLGLLNGKVLDYGCGRGKDCEVLSIDGYDPFYQPIMPSGLYDTILCTFVLNVVNETTQEVILSNIHNLLTDNGKAYITVRRDIKQEGITRINTYQRNVVLDLPLLITKKDKFATYIMEKK